jgi:hypothetical protein
VTNQEPQSTWVLVLLGNRTLIGKTTDFVILDPCFQLESQQIQVQKGIDPNGKPIIVTGQQRRIMAVSEIESFTSVAIPLGSCIKPVAQLSPDDQKNIMGLVKAILDNREAAARKAKVDAEAAALAGASFGGGARKEE